MSRRLIVTDGGREREVLVVATIVVGRDPTCDITGSDDLLSRRHAEFSLANNRVLVRDLGSRNGVFVNGTRVAETALNSNDLVQIGQLKIRFLSDDRPLTAAVVAVTAPPPVAPPPVVPMVDDEVTGYRPAPTNPASTPPSIGSRTMTLGDDEATSFVPAGSRTTSMPPSISEPAPVSAPPPPPRISAPTAVLDDPFAIASAPAPAPMSARRVDRAPTPAARSTSTGLLAAGVVMALGAVAVLVWQGQQAGLAIWLVAPLVVALVGAALVGSAIAGKAEQ